MTGSKGITGKLLGKIWMHYQRDLVPYQSLLLTFIYCPRIVQQCSDFSAGHAAGFSMFKDLFEQHQFVTFEYLQSSVDSVNAFQYSQVKNLVSKMVRRNVLRKDLTIF